VNQVTRQIAGMRREKGITQENMAQLMGTTLRNWQRIEAGQNLTLHTIARIANALGVSPRLVFDDGD
jgi:transcriptional regulator with XRE-family HTH domain